MVKSLSHKEISDLLKNNFVGRLACCVGGKPYVIPITYYYDPESNYIISHSGEGMKLEMMRRNPQVCFEIDSVRDLDNWDSVVTWGTFVELKGSFARRELHNMVSHLRDLLSDDHPHIQFLSDMSRSQSNDGKSVIYSIQLSELSGRAERSVRK